MRAVAAGPIATTCGHLTDEAKRDMIEFAQSTVALLGAPRSTTVDSCEAGYALFAQFGSYYVTFAGVMDFCLARKAPEDVAVEDVIESGTRATARIAGSRKEIRLRMLGDEWKIDAQDFSDVPTANEPPDRSCPSG